MKPISSLELAKICKVSQGTVDRALHDRGRIRAATRERILAAAAKHGYLPNPAAREIMTGSSPFVGAILPSVNSIFFMDTMDAICAELRKQSLQLLMASASDASEASELLREFGSRRMRGIILVSPEDHLVIDPIFAHRQRIFSIINPSPLASIAFVGPAEAQTGRTAVTYLATRGHRRIMHLSYSRRSWAICEREEGYRIAMKAIREKPVIIRPDDDQALFAAIRTHKPTAIFCHNDWLALRAIRVLAGHGIEVPRDISVLGVDNSPTFNTLYSSLTTLQYPFDSVAQVLSARLLGQPSARTALRVEPCRVIDRDTVIDITARI